MPDPTGSVTQGLVSFAMTAPVWAIILYLWARKDRKRDKKDEKTELKIDKIHESVISNNVKLALIEKDLSYNAVVANTISEIANRANKNEDDLNEAFGKIRTANSDIDENKRILRVKSRWAAHSFQKLIGRYNEVHKDSQIQIEPMPE